MGGDRFVACAVVVSILILALLVDVVIVDVIAAALFVSVGVVVPFAAVSAFRPSYKGAKFMRMSNVYKR